MTNKPDIDPQETQEWLDSLDAVLENEGVERAHFLLERLIDKARRSGAYLPFSANTAYLNTLAGDQAGALPREPRHRAAHPLLRALERHGHGGTGQPPVHGAGRAHLVVCLLRDPLRHRLQPLFPRPQRRLRRRHDLHPGPLGPGDLCPRLPGGAPQRGPALQLPPGGGRQRSVLLPTPLADAQLLAVPDGLHGARPHHGHLPGPLHALPDRPRHRERRGPQGLGLLRRRGDGRARVPGRHLAGGPRAPGQPGLRGQLQPAAPRRPGARQRQDHPGAGGGLPRCRLERHQGRLGELLGPALRPRQAGPAAQAHGGVRGRRLPGVQGQGRRLYPRALLRQVPGAGGPGRGHDRRRYLAPQPRRPRPHQGLCRLCRGHAPQGPADGDPGQDRQGLRHGQRRGGDEHHPLPEEDGRGGPQGLPRPLQYPDLRRPDRRRPLLQAGPGQPGDAVPARAPRGPGRSPARPPP